MAEPCFEKTIDATFDIKINAYLFDDGRKTDYYQTFNMIEYDSTFVMKDGIHFSMYYNDISSDDEMTQYMMNIHFPHETVHVITNALYKSNVIGIDEGFATYISSLYYETRTADDFFSYSFDEYIIHDIILSGDYPHYIFSLNFQDFQRINLNTFSRDSADRYAISSLFIKYLTGKFGYKKFFQWMSIASTDNFQDAFKFVYKRKFLEEEKIWMQDSATVAQ